MNKRKWLLVAAVFIAVTAVALVLKPKTQAPVDIALPLDESTVQFIRPTVVGMLDGERQWELETERMREHGKLIYLDQVSRGLLYRDGDEYLTFTANQGVWNRDTDELDLTGNVVVYRDGQHLLESERLLWDGRTEILTAPVPVTIRIDGNTIRSDEMIGYVKKDELVFQGNVELTAERLTLSVPDRLVYRVEDGSMSGLGPGRVQIKLGGKESG